jgi:hypothetical protein
LNAFYMRNSLQRLALLAVIALTSAPSLAERTLERLHLAGLGLQSPIGAGTPPSDLAFGSEAIQVWQVRGSSDYSLYSGTRESAYLGLRAAESYGGIVTALPGGWGSSLEAGYAPESLLAPRRYALTGQLHTPLSDGRSLSVGLKYRVQDTDASQRYGNSDSPLTNGYGYTLAPLRQSAGGFLPSFQLQMNYQYSAATSFGLALGREVETFTPIQDPAGLGPRPFQFSFTGQHWLTPTWALSYDVLSQDAATPLRALGLRLGVRYRF